MANKIESDRSTRRYVRVAGPFEGRRVGPVPTPVLIYDLNLGGGFVNFMHEQPEGATLVLRIALPEEGWITVNAETVYRHQFGFAVRFVDVDEETRGRLLRAVDALKERQAAH